MTLVVVSGIVLSACGGSRSRPVAMPVASAAPAPSTPAAPAPVAKPSPIDDARRAEREGRAVDALGIYEHEAAVAAGASAKLTALLGAVRLRLSADPAMRDLRRAQTLLESADDTAAAASVPLPIADLLQLLREAADLRTQLRAARADVKSLEAEMAKKDDALRRVTSAVVGGKTP
jgi:hypothetical protein